MKLNAFPLLMQRVLIALVAVGVAILLRLGPLQNMGTSLAYITFFPAVTIAALYGGRASGMLATLLSIIYVYLWQNAANPNFSVEGMILFSLTGLLLSSFSEAIFQAREKVVYAMEMASSERQRSLELKSAQQKAIESEQRFRELFESSPTAMVAIDPVTFHFLQANLNAQRICGYSERELQQMTLEELIHPDDRAECNLHKELLAKGLVERHYFEKRFLRKDGSSFWVESGISSLKGENGKAALLIGGFVDVSQRREIEAALKNSESTYRSLFENMINGFAHCKMLYQDGIPSDFIYLSVNSAFGRLTGLQNVVGRRVSEIIPTMKERDAGLLDAYARVVATGIPERFEYFSASMQMWFDVAVYRSTPDQFVALFDVITEQKLAAEKIEAYVVRLERAMQGTLQVVANMVELRDPYTSGHERRVGILAADIAREMGWADERCRNMELIGLVHDIGKIAIPAEILSKPTRLTALEFEMIKTHAERGYEILKDIDFSIPIAEIIREHHERMDGSGYPRGLKGDEILAEARVLAVADVIESMSSHRPYRAGLGMDVALAEIVAHRATLFDEDVVDAAVRLIKDKGYRLPV